MEAAQEKNNIFLVEILGFTNHCSLNCSYCDWERKPFSPLTELEIVRARRNLIEARFFIRRHYPQAQVIEYSGGEPYVHPEVVQLILEIFQDYWVRINTNGLHMNEAALAALARHGRAYLALSLDGHTLEANGYRLHSQAQLDRVIGCLDTILSTGIPVALLCTMHDRNVDGFGDYLQWLQRRWPDAIREGRLMMAAHRLSSYGKPHPGAGKNQRERMQAFLKTCDSPLVEPVREHYERLWVAKQPCHIHCWAASMHFLGDALCTTGQFTSFRCGMRGVGSIGEFRLSEEMERDHYSGLLAESKKTAFESYQCNCLVDWKAFDLVFSGVIPLERAKKWFLPFQDARIQNWIAEYQQRNNI